MARARASTTRVALVACALALALTRAGVARGDDDDDDRTRNTQAATTRDDARDGDGRPATTATAMETALLTTLAREEDARTMREAFEAFAREGGRAREYCGDDADAYPCEESRRREAIFYENMRVVRALRDAEDDSAALGHRSKGRRSKRSAEEAAAAEEEEEEEEDSRATFGPTLWSDRTREEFVARTGRLVPTPDGERDRSRTKKDSWREMHDEFLRRNADIWANERGKDGELYDANNLPKSWDWRKFGGLSKVWEQGACGGCWAFTTAAAVEGVHYIWTREAVTLSPQMLLECDPIDQDCTGGNMVTGYQYAVMKGGISAAEDYPVHPYTIKTSEVGPCRSNTARKHAASIDDYIVLENTWDDLKSAIYMQPVSVAVNAMGEHFRFYSGGILTYDQCQPDWANHPNLINHAVVAVGFGYDKTLDMEYVVIKNSWGTQWGENGYARIAMQGGELNATCGLLIEAVAPLKLSNLTYTDPTYVVGMNDYIDWAPHHHMSDVNGVLYVILTTVVLVAALSMGILTIISCMTEDDGYYYTDLDYDEYDDRFDIHRAPFGKEDRLHGLSVTQKLSRFQARKEPITGLSTASYRNEPRDMSNVKPHRGDDRL